MRFFDSPALLYITYKTTILAIQMQLFYTPDISLPEYTLPEEESAHCMKRAAPEDGRRTPPDRRVRQSLPGHRSGNPTRNTAGVRITETLPEYGKRSYGVTVAVAPTKNTDRYEWFLEKATETGIDRIIPIECRRSERRTLKREQGERR